MPKATIAADVGIAGRRVPQSANSIQLTSPGPPAALGSACKMRRPATQAMFQFESRPLAAVALRHPLLYVYMFRSGSVEQISRDRSE
jgi:hypothetical protein